MTAWRCAKGALEHLLAADFDFDGEAYRFAILEEWLIFFVHLADRLAHDRVAQDCRARLIKGMARRLAETVADNRCERAALTHPPAEFIARIDARGVDYADCRVQEGRPGMNFLRVLGQAVCAAAPGIDRKWLMEQVVEVEAPDAVRRFVAPVASVMDVAMQ